MGKFTLLILFLCMLPTTAALAGARHFTFLYEAPTSIVFKLAFISLIGRTHATVSNPLLIIRIPQSS